MKVYTKYLVMYFIMIQFGAMSQAAHTDNIAWAYVVFSFLECAMFVMLIKKANSDGLTGKNLFK